MDARMPKRPDIKNIEKKWQDYWENESIFRFDPDPESEKEIFSIDVPPRYVSGPLHIGHAVSYSHIDFIARYQRLRGRNVYSPLCFDGNGLPVEVNVEKTGISPAKVGRTRFLEECDKFSNANIGTMTEQFKRLGHSFDSSIYYQTNAEYYRKTTQLTFLEMFEKGYIYKGERPVNWCPRCHTALADAEIDYVEGETTLNYIKFRIDAIVGEKDKSEYVTIATTRPELLPACVLVAVHPEDNRYSHLVGLNLEVPIFEHKVKVVADDSVDPDFGTGIVMVCTFGDKEDVEKSMKFDTALIKAIDENGIMTDVAGAYKGLTTTDARKRVLEDLNKKGLLDKSDPHTHRYNACWRCGTHLELIITDQWFLKILPFKEEIKKAADRIKWHPPYMKTRLDNWTDSLKWDWCISRQRYFATPIPAWTCSECNNIITADKKDCYVDPITDAPPVDKCPECGGELKPVTEVFDTWFDSSISAIYNSYWGRNDALHKRMHPMSLRPQSHDIIRTWAFYSILRSILLTGKEPFRNIVISGFILGPDGAPMHTSDGNVVDPLDVIEQFGSEAIRFFAAHCGLGVDTSFNWETTKHGVSFNIKLWNISRFISMQMDDFQPDDHDAYNYTVMDKWMLSKLSVLVEKITDSYDEFDFHSVILQLEDFIWHSLADNYLEIVKHRIFNKENVSSRDAARSVLLRTMYAILKGLAPILPHITEEIYSVLFSYKGEKTIHIGGWPVENYRDPLSEQAGEAALEVISAMRKWKQENQLGLGTKLKSLVISHPEPDLLYEAKSEIAGTARSLMLEIKKGDSCAVVSGETLE